MPDAALRKQKDFSGEWEALERRAGEIGSELEVFRSGVCENYVSWIERRGRGIFLEACPVDVSGMLRERLFDRIPACVLTSATLTVAESFEYFRQRIGMTEGRGVFAVDGIQRPQADDAVRAEAHAGLSASGYLQRAVEEIKNILEASQGRAFVLFTSYQQMMAVYELVSRDLPFPAWCRPQRRQEPAAGRIQDHAECGAVRDVELLAGRRCEGRSAERGDHRQAAVPGAVGSAGERAHGAS